MANSAYAVDGTLSARLLATSQTPQFKLGQNVFGTDNSEWIYVTTAGAVAAGAVCNLDTSFNAVAATTANTKRGMTFAIPQVAFAAGDYGWMQRRGPVKVVGVQVAASTPVTKLNTTTTAGQLDGSALTGSIQVDGLILGTAQGGAAGLNTTGNAIGLSAGATN